MLGSRAARALGWSHRDKLFPARWPPEMGLRTETSCHSSTHAGDLHSLREGPWKQRGPNSAPWGVQATAGLRGWASQGPLNTHPGFRDHTVNSTKP